MIDTCVAFSIPIFRYSVENWKENKNRILSLLNLTSTEEHCTDYYQNIDKFPSYSKDVFDLLTPALNAFAEVYSKEVRIKMIWAQKYRANNYHQIHNHGGLGYSAVFYAQFDNTHQATAFYAPYVDFIEGNVLEYVPEVSEGDIIFFPSVLMHQCKPVQSDTERIIISFNIY